MQPKPTGSKLLCPSAQPGMEECAVIGFVENDGDERLITYLDHAYPVDEELEASTVEHPELRQMLRFSATCAEHSCAHFDGTDCRLARRTAALLQPVVEGVPACAIRKDCRWFRQEGVAVCRRCPGVATLESIPTPLQELVAYSAHISGAE